MVGVRNGDSQKPGSGLDKRGNAVLSSQPQSQKDLHTKKKWTATISDLLGAVPADLRDELESCFCDDDSFIKARDCGGSK